MNDSVKKATEIRDAKISFVSLVDKAANKKQFLITKAENGTAQFQIYGRILKAEKETHHVTGIVYEPLVEDAQGDFMTAEEIQKAAYWFAKNGVGNDIQHSFKPQSGLTVVESWIAKADFEIDGEQIKKGTWLMTVEVTDADVWSAIEKGEITGFSMGGCGQYGSEDVDLSTLNKGGESEKRGVLKRLAEMLGIHKSEFSDEYEHRELGARFYTALDVLENVLWYWGKEPSEEEIRQSLSDFSNTITEILASKQPIAKMLTGADRPVGKAGKKMSGKNRATLTGIYESLGAFLTEFDDPEPTDDSNTEEGTEVTKQEIEKMIEEGVTKAISAIQKAAEPEPATQPETVAKAAEITPEAIAEMVEAAVAKATQPTAEPLTLDQVQKMVTAAVEKAVEPIMKRTGTPSNLNSAEGSVEKQEQHYLHGIL